MQTCGSKHKGDKAFFLSSVRFEGVWVMSIIDILRLPLPKEQLKTFMDLDADRLKKLRIDTILFDYDNTLAPWRSRKLDNRVKEFIYKLLDDGFKVAIVTNAGHHRVRHIQEEFRGKVKVFHTLFKPGIRKLKMVLKVLRSSPETTAIVGDLFVTDIIAGNRLGMYTILVNPYVIGVRNLLHRIMAVLTRIFYLSFYYTLGWFLRFVDLATPNEWKKSVLDVDYDLLLREGYRVFLFDYDNTLGRWRNEPDPRAVKLLNYLLERGAKVLIVSNGRTSRIKTLRRFFPEGVLLTGSARKPLLGRIKKILKSLNVKPSEMVIIGDQLLTDVLLGSRLGAYTIKVKPVDPDDEAFVSKINRLVEKMVIKLHRKKFSLEKIKK